MIVALGMNLPVPIVCHTLPSDFNWNYNELAGGKAAESAG